MRDYLLVGFVVASVPIGLLVPYYALLVYAWISYMYPQMYVWGFGQTFPSAKLMACAAVHLYADLRDIVDVHLVLHRMLIHRVSETVLNREHRNDTEILVWQPHLTVEDGYYLLALNLLRLRIRPVAFEAKFIDVARPQIGRAHV